MSSKPTYEELEQNVKNLEREIKEHRKSEYVSQEYETRYDALFNRLLDCVYLHDLEGNFVDANPAALDMIGYNKEEIPSVNFKTLLSHDQFPKALEVFLEVKKLGYDSKLREFKLKDKFGNYVWVEAKSSMIYRDEKPFLIQGIARDITARKLAEEELTKYRDQLEELVKMRTTELTRANEQLQLEMDERKQAEKALQETKERYIALFDRSLDCVFVNNLDGVFIDANPAALNLVGYKKEDISSLSYSSLLNEEQLQRAIEGVIEILETGFQKDPLELIIRRKDGKYVHVESKGSLIYQDGKPYAIQGIARDITKRKQAEKNLRDREKELEINSINLEEANTALKVLLKRVEEDKKELENKILLNTKGMVDPYLEKLRRTDLNERQQAYLDILESNLNDIVSPLAYRLTSVYFSLTPKEMDVANLVKQGKANKEIAELMNISIRTVEIHRERIREKLGIRGKKTNLRTHLLSFQ